MKISLKQFGGHQSLKMSEDKYDTIIDIALTAMAVIVVVSILIQIADWMQSWN